MKKENQKKSKLWLWILLAVLALAIIGGVVAAFVLPGMFQQGGPTGPTAEAKLYWNLDRLSWLEEETNMSAREKAEDGYYYIRYAFDGKVEELKITDDKRLVNYLDSQDLICLAFDENGVVVDCVPASTYFTPAAKDLYTKRVQGNMLQLNSSMAMNGMDMEFDISNIPVYEVAEGSKNKGELVTPQWLDVVTVYSDLEGNPYAAYVTGHLAINAEVGWRVESGMYSASTGYKRTPDENGVYTIPFAINGEIVNRYCRDLDMCISIENQSMYTAYFALEYDEEGYIIDWENPAMAMQGTQLCAAFNVDTVQDGVVTATRYLSGNNQGEQVQFTYDETTEIYHCCIGGCYKDHCGERIDSLKEGDMISVFTDLDGKPTLIYVAIRTVDTPPYYNLNQQWSWSLNETLRVPDEDGYYVFEMAVNGGVKTVRTKSKELANKIDGNHSFASGLELSGSVIKRVYGIQCVSGRAVAFGGRFVTSYNRPIVSVASASDITNVANYVMRSDCKIYNVEDNYGVKRGTKGDFKPGDKVLGLMDARGELNYIYIQQRTRTGYKIGYNMARKYSTVIGGTTRVPNEEGYYVYDIAYDGNVIQLKTKNKAMADFIDFQNAPVIGFKYKDGIITDVCTAASAIPYGIKQYNYNNIENMNGGILTSWYMSNGVKTLGTAQWKITSKTKTYNVSKGYEDHPGEKSKPKVGDKIQALVNNATGEIEYIFIMNRPVDSPIYWMVSRVAPKYLNGELVGSNRTPDEDGYYVIDLLHDGKIKQFKTKDEMIAAEVDTYTQGLGLKLKDGTNIIDRVVSIADTKYPATAIGNQDVKKINGNTITTERCRLTSSNYGEVLTNKLTSKTKIYDVSSYAKNWGAATKLSIGDRIVAYTDLEGNIAYIFITKAAAREKGVWGYCDHCGKKVFWDSYSETFAADGHYYLPADTTYTSAITFGSSLDEVVYDQVFDLNGHTLKSTTNAFTVRDKLTIVDSVGTGKISGGKGLSFNGSKQGGNIFVAEGGTFTLLSGTIENGAVGLTGIGSNISAYNGTVNIKGGKISGGVGYLGTAVYHSGTKGGINISGGKLGGNVFAEESNMVTLSGAPTIEKLIVAPGNKIKLGALKSGASITVKGDGIFTNEYSNINALKAYFKTANSKDTITVSGKALKYNNLSGEQVIPEPENPNKPLELDKNGMGTCVLCGEKVQWTALHEGDIIGDMNPLHPEFKADLFGGDQHQFHYYVAEDMTSGDGDFLYGWQGNVVCLHLNGKTLNVRGGFYGGNGSTINIYGDGKVHYLANSTTSYTAGNMFEAYTSNINLYGGEFTSATNMIHGAGSALQLSISDDAIINGNVKLDYGNATISGNIYVKRIIIGETAKLSITRLFKGEASLSVVAGLEEGNLIPEANVAVLGKFTGKLTYADFRDIVYENGRLKVLGEAPSPNDALKLDANGMGICYVCGENVKWTALHGGNVIGDINSDGQSLHYYVAEDMTAGDGNFQFIRDKSADVAAKAPVNICLHLNGNILNVRGIIENGHGCTTNIMGNGIVLNGGTQELFQTYTANLNLYGGEYYGGEYPVYKTLGEAAKINVMGDANIYGTVELPYSGLTLKENGRVDNVLLSNTVVKRDTDQDGEADDDVTIYGKVTVAANWNGKAKLTVAEGNMDGKLIKPESGIAQGDFTGVLINQDGKKFVNSEGQLKLTNKTGSIPAAPAAPEAPAVSTAPLPEGINDNLVLDSENKAMCVHCGEVVVWTPIYNGESIGNIAGTGSNLHFYLEEDNTSGGAFIRNMAGEGFDTVCLHLNGHNLSTEGGFVLQNASKFNLMGNGNVVRSTGGQLFEIWTCVVNIYGGNFTGDTAMSCSSSGSKVSVLGDVVLNGLVNLTNGSTYFAHNVSASVVDVSATGKLILASDWNGSLEISVAEDLMEGNLVKVSAVELLGKINGTITHNVGVVTIVDGRLCITLPEPKTPVWGVFNPEECNNMAYCPVCGEAAGVFQWTKISTGADIPGYLDNSETGANGTMEHGHYYLAKDFSHVSSAQFIGLNRIGACLHLNGHKLTTKSRLFATGAGYALNIIAGENGAIEYDGTNHAAGIFNNVIGLNIIGGTYTSTQTTGEIKPILQSTGPVTLTDAVISGIADVKSTITVKGSTSLDNLKLTGSGKLVIEEGWSGNIVAEIPMFDIVDDLVDSNRISVNGNFTGTVTVNGKVATRDGNQLRVEGGSVNVNAPLELDSENKGMCLLCGVEVQWTALHEGDIIGDMNPAHPEFDADKFGGDQHQFHYYVAEDMTAGDGDFLYTWQSNTVCLHLNGKTLNVRGGFYGGNNSTINICGEGQVNHLGDATVSYTAGNMFEAYTSNINIYGGEFTSASNVIHGAGSNLKLSISNIAKINGTVKLDYGNLTIGGNVNIKRITLGKDAKMTIAGSYKGEATLFFAGDLEEGNLIPAANAVALGEYTGKLTYTDFREVINVDGRLKVVGEAPSPNDPLVLDENNMAICYVCGEKVQWTALYGGNVIGDVHSDGQKLHYYVAEDMTADNGNFQFIRDKSEDVAVKAPVTICLHLNGKILNVKGVIENGHGSTTNIMGNGTMLNGGAAELFQSYSATLNLYGGQYYAGGYPAFKALGEFAKLNVMGDAKLYGNVELPYGGLTLKDNARVDNVVLGNTVVQRNIDEDEELEDVTIYGKVTVAAKWAGEAKLTVAEGNMDGKLIKPESGIAQGDFTGALINQDGKKFVNSEGQLKLTNKTGSIPAAPAAPEAPAVPTAPLPEGINDNLVLNSENKAMCVHCGEEVVWTPIANGESIGNLAATGSNLHYYLTEDNVSTGAFIRNMAGDGFDSICLHLNGHNLTTEGGFVLQNASKFNLMGNGNVTRGSAGLLFEIWTCTVNIYGGNFTSDMVMQCASSGSKVSVLGDVKLNGLVKLTNGLTCFAHNVSATTVDISASGKLQLANGWNGTMEIRVAEGLMEGDLVKKSAVELVGNVNGTITHSVGTVSVVNGQLCITLPEPSTPVWGVFNPEACDNKAYCPACGEAAGVFQWTKISSSADLPGYKDNTATGANGTMEHFHYYLAKDYVHASGAQFIGLNRIGACLHLNGHKLSTQARLFITGAGYSMNIIAGENGAIEYDGTNHVAGIINNVAGLNIIGGTYTSTQTTGEIKPILQTTGTATLTDAVVSGISDVKNTITVKGSTSLNNLVLTGSGKLVVDAGWSGNITMSIPLDDIVNGYIKTSRAVVNGDFTGTISLTDGRTAVKDGNRLKVVGELPNINDNLVLDAQNKAMCQHCGKEVIWTPLAADEIIGTIPVNNNELHYYLTEDNTNADRVNFLKNTNGTGTDSICLHLNGHNLTTKMGFVLQSSSKFALMGNGTVSCTGEGWLLEIWTSEVKIYGGTFTGTNLSVIKSGNSKVTITGDATFNSPVEMSNGVLTVGANASFTDLKVLGGKMTIAEGWAGTMVLTVSEADVVDNLIKTDRVVVEGDFTGTITTTDGKSVTKEGNQLKIGEAAPQPPAPSTPTVEENLSFKADGKTAYCPVCKADKEWTAYTGQYAETLLSDTSGVLHYHFYLEDDLTYTTTNALDTYETICFHLNGHDIIASGTEAGRPFSCTQVFNLMGTGTVYGGTKVSVNTGTIMSVNGGNASGRLHIYSGTLKNTEGVNAFLLTIGGNGGEINIHGGTIDAGTGDAIYAIGQNSVAQVKMDGGTVNGNLLIGSTYIAEARKEKASLEFTGGTVNGMISSASSAPITIGGGATATSISIPETSKLTVKADFTGTATVNFAAALVDNKVPAANGVAEGNFTGTLTLSTGAKLVNDNGSLKAEQVIPAEPVWGTFDPWNHDGKAYCEHCGEAAGVQTWTELKGSNRIGALDDGNHYHVYLSENVDVDKTLTQTLSMYSGTSVCLNLNGKNLTNHGRFFTSGTGTLAIMGDGNMIFAADTTTPGSNNEYVQAFVVGNTGGAYLYGGNYSVTGNAVTLGLPTVRVTGKLYVKDAVIDGFVNVENGATVTLENSADVDDIRIVGNGTTTTGKLVVAADWTGTAKLTLPEGILVDGVIAAANGVAEGDFTGALTLATGEKVTNDNGSLKAEFVNPVWGIFEPWKFGGRAYCEACGQDDGPRTWTVYTGEYCDGDNVLSDPDAVTHYHFYLDEDVTYETANFLNTYENICFNLNGHSITAAGTNCSAPMYSTQQLCIMGEGTIIGCATSSADAGSVFQVNGGNASGSLKIYGGTFKKPANSTNPLLSIGDNGGRVFIYGGTFDVNGGAAVGDRGSLIYATGCDTGSRQNFAQIEINGGTFIGDCRIGSINTAAKYDGMASMKVLGGSFDGKIAVTNKCEATLGGAAVVKEIAVDAESKLTVKKDFTGKAVVSFASELVENVVPADNGVAEGNFAGTLSLTDSTPLVADGTSLKVPANANLMKNLVFAEGTKMAVCPKCGGEAVEWTDLNAKSDKRIGYNSNKGHLHFYLSDDFVATETLQFAELEGNTTLCFHLNGHNLTTSSRFITTSGATTNILGRGNVVFEGDCTHANATTYNSVGFEVGTNGTLNVYGGSYSLAGAAKEAGKPMFITSTASSTLNLYDVYVADAVTVRNGLLNVDVSAQLPKLNVNAGGKLNVAGTFTGAVTANFANGLADNAIPDANGSSTGAFTGTVTLTDETVLIGQEGKLVKKS